MAGERAGLAATVISYRSRSAIREVGKAMGLSEDLVGTLAAQAWGVVAQPRSPMPRPCARWASTRPDLAWPKPWR